MLSSVLRSERAVQVNIAIIRAFVHLRTLLATHETLCRKIEQMERKYDSRFQAVFATIKQMLAAPIGQKERLDSTRRPVAKGIHSFPRKPIISCKCCTYLSTTPLLPLEKIQLFQ
jgi:hypothetical protein